MGVAFYDVNQITCKSHGSPSWEHLPNYDFHHMLKMEFPFILA